MQHTTMKQFNFASSCVAFNNGNGNFNIVALPPMVQLSSVNAVNCSDINGDGLPDIIAGGNNFWFPPQFGRLDANFGTVLLNKGKRLFEWLYPNESGLNLSGQVRDVVTVRNNKRRFVLFLINDEYPALYEINNRQQTK
jgi:hypothetical protein